MDTEWLVVDGEQVGPHLVQDFLPPMEHLAFGRCVVSMPQDLLVDGALVDHAVDTEVSLHQPDDLAVEDVAELSQVDFMLLWVDAVRVAPRHVIFEYVIRAELLLHFVF